MTPFRIRRTLCIVPVHSPTVHAYCTGISCRKEGGYLVSAMLVSASRSMDGPGVPRFFFIGGQFPNERHAVLPTLVVSYLITYLGTYSRWFSVCSHRDIRTPRYSVTYLAAALYIRVHSCTGQLRERMAWTLNCSSTLQHALRTRWIFPHSLLISVSAVFLTRCLVNSQSGHNWACYSLFLSATLDPPHCSSLSVLTFPPLSPWRSGWLSLHADPRGLWSYVCIASIYSLDPAPTGPAQYSRQRHISPPSSSLGVYTAFRPRHRYTLDYHHNIPCSCFVCSLIPQQHLPSPTLQVNTDRDRAVGSRKQAGISSLGSSIGSHSVDATSSVHTNHLTLLGLVCEASL